MISHAISRFKNYLSKIYTGIQMLDCSSMVAIPGFNKVTTSTRTKGRSLPENGN